MPELPEVETIRRDLSARILGAQITSFELYLTKALRNTTEGELVPQLIGRTLTGFGRRGKHLIMELSSGAKLVVHLRMTGQLLVMPQGTPLQKHTTFRMGLDGGREIHLVDLRKFATVDFLPDGDESTMAALRTSGIEPLEPGFTREQLGQMLAQRRMKLKSWLLDQRFIAGLGNIYADESLFRSGIHPLRPAGSLTEEEVDRLHQAIIATLQEAVAAGGSSIRDYRDSRGERGQFQNQLRVYGRRGEPCPSCEESIDRIKIGGRSSYYCPRCQR
ncbi:MAG: bifunctional DNA-formamidopyrimidine glycosylase/DNA-(apurinic or apyrimidinic site) lyase [Limnochordia bacterium]